MQPEVLQCSFVEHGDSMVCVVCGCVVTGNSEKKPIHIACGTLTGIAIDKANTTYLTVTATKGPGDFLHDSILALFKVSPVLGCGCESRITQMNLWGIAECRKRIGEITQWLVDQAKEHKWELSVYDKDGQLIEYKEDAPPWIVSLIRVLLHVPLANLAARWVCAKMVLAAINAAEEWQQKQAEEEAKRPKPTMKWSYGITTCTSRFTTTLPKTMESLKAAGFDTPHIFLDGPIPPQSPEWITEYMQGHATIHDPPLKTFGNWITSLWELYLRDPHADRYAMFQDDIITVKNLRFYLEKTPIPDKKYLSLYTYPKNARRGRGINGWFDSNQRGYGALGLVLSRRAVTTLLGHAHILNRPQFVPQDKSRRRWWKSVDGAISWAMRKAGYRELVHMPSLVQHMGIPSSMGNGTGRYSPCFPGEDFDALTLVANHAPKIIEKPRKYERIGLIGYNCTTGLGELHRQIVEHVPVEHWLIPAHKKYPTLPEPVSIKHWQAKEFTRDQVESFVKSVDVVLFCEKPKVPSMLTLAKQHGRRVVCVPMLEWTPDAGRDWTPFVDLFVCPTKHCYDSLSKNLPCELFSWPVDVNRFKFQERSQCNRFLFVEGHGGYKGRKGSIVVHRAKELWPEMPLTVISQVGGAWPGDTEVLPAVEDAASLYQHGDVLLIPHAVDGLGLELMEAMASGMPVIVTAGQPWDESPALARIPATTRREKVGRMVDWYIADQVALVEICGKVLGTDVSDASREARAWAESRAWKGSADRFVNLCRGMK